ncbi:MAG: methyltransferase domain-containing protein [Alphaproteobacteria bacterium]|nr:methyltransferase domain-containing protein [Alphaproteobacteria bacterium]
MTSPRYDRIGHGYASRRVEDPRLGERIRLALGDARTVVNVGAGAGSYEPEDRTVLAVEPSAVMAAQRPPGRPAIRATADQLPLHDRSVDAAMTVLSLHHWHPSQERGIRELCRVARDAVVIVTIDPQVSGEMWLMADYLHEVRDLDHRICPPVGRILDWLDRPAEVEVVPISRDTPDGTLMSFWAHPERVLDTAARAATSGFARQPDAVVERVVRDVAADLRSGAWDARHGRLRQLGEYDAGLRLIRASRGA